MSNSLSVTNPEFWSATMQRTLKKTFVAGVLGNYEERASLKKGDAVHRPKKNRLNNYEYVPGQNVTIQDVSASDETLLVDKSREVSFYIDKIEEFQSNYNLAFQYGDEAAYSLRNEIDGRFLSEVVNASQVVDAGDFGGTSGQGYQLDPGKVLNWGAMLQTKMYANQVEDTTSWHVVADPYTIGTVMQSKIANGFNVADSTLNNGIVGDYLKFKFHMSNNTLIQTTVTYSGTISNDETFTITIGGRSYVLTWKTTLGSTAGNVLIGANQDESFSNLVSAINKTSGAGTTYVALTDAQYAELSLSRISATVNTSTDTFTLSSNGTAFVSTTATNATVGATISNILVCQKGAIDIVKQIAPTSQVNKAELKSGYNFLNFDLYGIKTFDEGAQRMLNAKVRIR